MSLLRTSTVCLVLTSISSTSVRENGGIMVDSPDATEGRGLDELRKLEEEHKVTFSAEEAASMLHLYVVCASRRA